MPWPVLNVLSWLSCPRLTYPGFPVQVVLSQLSCPCYYDLATLSSMSCPGWPVMPTCPDVPVVNVLSQMTCLGCVMVAATVVLSLVIISQKSCSCCHGRFILFFLSLLSCRTVLSVCPSCLAPHTCPQPSCLSCPVLAVIFKPSYPICAVLAVLSYLYCPGCPVPDALS
jgi:hypothetical protein